MVYTSMYCPIARFLTMLSHLALLLLRVDMDIQNRLDLTDSYDFCDGYTLNDLDGIVINMDQNKCIPQVHCNSK